MKIRHGSKLAGLVAVLVLLLTEADAGSKPTINTLQFTQTYVDTEICAFDVSVEVTMTVKEFIFYDDSGNPVKVQVHIRLDAVETNVETGKSVLEHDVGTLVIDLSTGETTVLGPIRLKRPNGGVLVIDVGKVVFDPAGNITFAAGPHPFFVTLGGDFAQLLCPALE